MEGNGGQKMGVMGSRLGGKDGGRENEVEGS